MFVVLMRDTKILNLLKEKFEIEKDASDNAYIVNDYIEFSLN